MSSLASDCIDNEPYFLDLLIPNLRFFWLDIHLCIHCKIWLDYLRAIKQESRGKQVVLDEQCKRLVRAKGRWKCVGNYKRNKTKGEIRSRNHREPKAWWGDCKFKHRTKAHLMNPPEYIFSDNRLVL